MININPIELQGNWEKGFALDLHTLESVHVGDSPSGHPLFDTKRTGLGDLVFRLKNRGDKSVIGDIVNTVSTFLENDWKIIKILDCIIPVPPSNLDRTFQPVIEIAESLCGALNIHICDDSLVKEKATPELKGILGYPRRMEILKDAFNIQNDAIENQNVLLFDDLYRSGASLQVITEVLYKKGKVKNVYVLTLTKTRRNR